MSIDTSRPLENEIYRGAAVGPCLAPAGIRGVCVCVYVCVDAFFLLCAVHIVLPTLRRDGFFVK